MAGASKERTHTRQTRRSNVRNKHAFAPITPPVPPDAATYLEEVLPALLSVGLPPSRSVVIQFVVADGVDVFYRFEAGQLRVLRGISDDVDLTLAFRRQSDVVRFANAQLDVTSALRSERLKIHGDEELLPWLAERLRW